MVKAQNQKKKPESKTLEAKTAKTGRTPASKVVSKLKVVKGKPVAKTASDGRGSRPVSPAKGKVSAKDAKQSHGKNAGKNVVLNPPVEEGQDPVAADSENVPLENAELVEIEIPPNPEEVETVVVEPVVAATPELAAPEETDLDVSSLYFRDISEYRILTAGEEKSAFEEMEKILREAWRQVLEVPQIHPEFANLIKEVLKANLGRIHEAARTYAAREGDPEVQKILRAKAPGMFTNRNRFSTTLMRIDPDLIILDGVLRSFSRFTRANVKGQPVQTIGMGVDEELPEFAVLRKSLGSKDIEKLKERLKMARRYRVLITNKRNAFLAANLKLVISVAKKYRGHSLTFDDMIQEGNMGLMTAIGRFDHRLGYKFSTYATWWIRQSITRALSVKDRTIRLPVHLHEIYYRVRRVTAELKEKLARNPSPEEIAGAAGLRPDQIKDYSHLFVEPESLDAGHDSDDDRTLGEFIPDGDLVPSDEATEHFRLSEEIKEILKSLTPREEDILRRRFGIGQARDYTLQEIAERYHLTRERIRQIEAKGLEKLRRPNRKRKLEEYNREMLS